MECKSIPRNTNQLSVLITDDKEIRELNAFYRGKDKATDVLSFSQIEGRRKGMSTPALGDIVISLERAIVQAKRYRVSLSKELLRLLIHGILHLFGYDHVKVARSDAELMRSTERMLMAKYGRGIALL